MYSAMWPATAIDLNTTPKGSRGHGADAVLRRGGIPHVRVRPLSYMTGEIELSLDELTRWRMDRDDATDLSNRKPRSALLEMAGSARTGCC